MSHIGSWHGWAAGGFARDQLITNWGGIQVRVGRLGDDLGTKSTYWRDIYGIFHDFHMTILPILVAHNFQKSKSKSELKCTPKNKTPQNFEWY